jgi:hypothetical protein
MPCRQEEEKNGGPEGGSFPSEEVEERKSQITHKEPKQKGDAVGFLPNPSGNPRVTSTVGHAEDHGRGEKEEGSQPKGLVWEKKAQES